jgi:hypothetical protein
VTLTAIAVAENGEATAEKCHPKELEMNDWVTAKNDAASELTLAQRIRQ